MVNDYTLKDLPSYIAKKGNAVVAVQDGGSIAAFMLSLGMTPH
jgi:hypothetical protein